MKSFIGIDNGVSGTIAILSEESFVCATPVKKEQNYTKKKDNISRVEVIQLHNLLSAYTDPIILIERPMVNPKMFKATLSAVRALEATLNVIELLELPYQYIDSKEWQKALLPEGVKGRPELKKASVDIGCRLFPQHREIIEKHGDADGLLIAEYCRRKFG